MVKTDGSERNAGFLGAEACMAATQVWVVVCLFGGGMPFQPVAAVLGVALLPAFNMSLHLARGRLLPAFVFSLCLAPLCAGASGCLTHAFGLSSSLGAIAPALLTMPLAGFAGFYRCNAKREAGSGSGSDPGLAAAIGVGILLAAFTAGLLLFSGTLRLSWHGLLHSSITYGIIDSGVPPENPYFAGQPLVYYWFYHLSAAGITTAANLSPLFSFSVFNIFASLSIVPCLYLISRGIGLAPKTSLLGSVIGTLALNPLGPLFLVLQDSGVTFKDIEGELFPTHLLQYMTMGYDFRLASPCTKFWNVSSFAPALALFLLGIHAGFDRASRGWRWRSFCLIAAAAFGTLILNPLVGLCLVLPLGAASLVWAGKGNRARFCLVLCALAAGVGAAAPCLAGILAQGGGEPFMHFGPALEPFMGVILAAGPVLLFAVLGAFKLCRLKELSGMALSVFCACLVLMALFFCFPEGNEYKIIRLLVFPAAVLAGAPAVAFLSRLRLPRVVSVPAVAAALLPNTLIAGAAYLCDSKSAVPVDDSDTQIVLCAGSAARGDVYRFLRNETPPDSVVVVNPGDGERSVGGHKQGDEVPAFARRAIYTGHRFYLTERMPGFESRLERARALFSGKEAPLPEPVLGRPLYVLVRSEQHPELLNRAPFEKVYENGVSAVFKLKMP